MNLIDLIPGSVPPPEPGVYENVSFDTYASWAAVNCGMTKAFAHSAKMCRYRMTQPEEDKPVYLKGRLFHLLSTQPELAESEFCVQPATYTNDKGEEKPWHNGANVCKEWNKQMAATGMTIVSAEVLEECRGMAEAIRTHERAGLLIDGGTPEVSVVWVDSRTGLTCKCRWDVLKNGILGDLKSCQSAKPDPWFSTSYRYNYHIQAAMYLDAAIAVSAIPGGEVPWWVFVAVESYPPFDLAVYDVQDDPDAGSYAFLDLGRKTYYGLLHGIKQTSNLANGPDTRRNPVTSTFLRG